PSMQAPSGAVRRRPGRQHGSADSLGAPTACPGPLAPSPTCRTSAVGVPLAFAEHGRARRRAGPTVARGARPARGRAAVERRLGAGTRRLALRAHGSFPLPRAGLRVRCRVHDRRPPDPRLGGARRPEPAPPRRAGEAGGAQPARRRVPAGVRPERVVLRLGGSRQTRARRAREALSFGSTAPWTVGVEEELVLVDPETLQPAPVFERGLAVPERLKAELFACLVEAATPVCRDAAQALDSLVCLRREAANRAARAGARLVAIGIHPLARSHGQPIVCEPRYEEMVAKLGDAVYRQLVCGLHVHVGVASEEACLRALEGVLPWLPTLIALAANSPFAEGADTGCRSARTQVAADRRSSGAGPTGRRRSPGATTRGCGGTSGRIRATGRSRSVSPTSRRACSARLASPPSPRRSSPRRPRRTPSRSTVRATWRSGGGRPCSLHTRRRSPRCAASSSRPPARSAAGRSSRSSSPGGPKRKASSRQALWVPCGTRPSEP